MSKIRYIFAYKMSIVYKVLKQLLCHHEWLGYDGWVSPIVSNYYFTVICHKCKFRKEIDRYSFMLRYYLDKIEQTKIKVS